jgi:hypothetical protein
MWVGALPVVNQAVVVTLLYRSPRGASEIPWNALPRAGGRLPLDIIV